MSLVVNVGMWLERFVIIVTRLHRDFLPSSWGMYYPTIWDFVTFFGTIGLFMTLMFLFVRVLPMISIFEMRTLLPQAKVEGRGGALMPCTATMPTPTLYGLMAEFDDPNALVEAAQADATPPATARSTPTRRSRSSGLGSAGRARRPVSLFVLCGGIVGMLAASACSTGCRRSPIRSTSAAGRYNSWPSFIPVTFELTILFAAFAAVLVDDRAERAADAVSPGVQRAALRSARARTSSSSRSRRPTRSSIATKTFEFLKSLGAERDQ